MHIERMPNFSNPTAPHTHFGADVPLLTSWLQFPGISVVMYVPAYQTRRHYILQRRNPAPQSQEKLKSQH
jgi:hypothetical protein